MNDEGPAAAGETRLLLHIRRLLTGLLLIAAIGLQLGRSDA